MARISISKVLQSKRRLKLVTLVSFLILAIVSVQLLVTNNAKRSVAADSCNAAGLCTVNTLDHIPAIFENKDVVIESGATVYADKVRVWQDTAAGHTKGQECSADSPNLYGYWPMDETMYSEAANMVHPEYSLYGSHDPAQIVDGKFGKARKDFEPTVNVDLTTDSDDLKYFLGIDTGFFPTGGMGIGAWFNWDGSDQAYIVYTSGFSLRVDNDNKVRFYMNDFSVVLTSDAIDEHEWYWVFATYKNGEMQLILKDETGAVQTHTNNAPPPMVHTSSHFYVAADEFDGILDDVRFYNKFPNDSDKDDSLNGRYNDTTKNEQKCNTVRHFKSLTIRNNSTLTHTAVTALDMREDVTNPGFRSLADENTGIARWKRVDFEVDGETRIETGSKIDVTGKGYAGADRPWSGIPRKLGYGPGRGAGGYDNDQGYGAGGGYGGRGGSWEEGGYMPEFCNEDPALYPCGGPAYFNESVFDFGSGGGSGRESSVTAMGGHGGGRIRLATGTLTHNGSLIADGIQGENKNASGLGNIASGGGGSGGHIEIITSDEVSAWAQAIQGASYIPVVSATDTAYSDATDGAVVVRDGKLISIPPGNSVIRANGGISNRMDVGGGGAIIIKGPGSVSGVTIKKTLEAVNRPSTAAPVNANFNPYALQDNDKIRVKLEVSGLTVGQQYTISDAYLKNFPITKSCKKTGAALPVENSLDPITWTITAAAISQTLQYECIVQDAP